jgi:hypothetical protein
VESGSAREEEIMTQKQNSGGQRANAEQSKTKTATEFFREKFADEEEPQPVWIDPKGDSDELSKHGFVAGQTEDGKSVHLAGLLDDEDGDREAES